MAVDNILDGTYREYTKPLTEFASRFKPKKILEVGFGNDALSPRIWLTFTDAHITTIDIFDWPLASQLQQIHPDRFKFLLGKSEDVLPTVDDKFDLIYIDGDHRYETVKQDLLLSLDKLKPKGVLLLDDYGVTGGGGMTFEDGRPVSGEFGVGRAADEVLKGWKQVYKDIKFANGGRAYAQTKSR